MGTVLLYARVGRSGSNTGPVISSLFSFNHQHGACPECDGLGQSQFVTRIYWLLIPESQSWRAPWMALKPENSTVILCRIHSNLKAVGKSRGVDFSLTWQELKEHAKNLAMAGAGDEIFDVTWEYRRNKRKGEHHFKGRWQGLVDLVNEEYSRNSADHRGNEMMDVMKKEECPACHGTRLCPKALSYEIQGINIAMLSAMTVSASIGFFRDPEFLSKSPSLNIIASPLLQDILKRLEFIQGMGLSYLSTDRSSSTLSGGEAQRIRLAGQMGSDLTGITNGAG